MKNLPRLSKQVEHLSVSVTRQFSELARDSSRKASTSAGRYKKMMATLQRVYPRFYLKQRVTEEFVHLADEAHHTSLYLQTELAKNFRSKKRRLQLQTKVRELETSLWFSLSDYAEEYRTLKNWLRQAFKPRPKWSRPIFVWLSPSRRNTPIAVCRFWTLSKKETWDS